MPSYSNRFPKSKVIPFKPPRRRHKRRWPWGPHIVEPPVWLINRRGVKDHIKILYQALQSWAGNKTECWPKVKTLGRCIGKPPKNVRRYLREMEKLGLIEVELVNGKASTYRLLDHPWMRGNETP